MRIANRLYDLTKLGLPEVLPGSWDVNVIRTTSRLHGLLSLSKFETIQTNILSEEGKEGWLLILHEDVFIYPWQHTVTPENVELADIVKSR